MPVYRTLNKAGSRIKITKNARPVLNQYIDLGFTLLLNIIFYFIFKNLFSGLAEARFVFLAGLPLIIAAILFSAINVFLVAKLLGKTDFSERKISLKKSRAR